MLRPDLSSHSGDYESELHALCLVATISSAVFDDDIPPTTSAIFARLVETIVKPRHYANSQCVKF